MSWFEDFWSGKPPKQKTVTKTQLDQRIKNLLGPLFDRIEAESIKPFPVYGGQRSADPSALLGQGADILTAFTDPLLSGNQPSTYQQQAGDIANAILAGAYQGEDLPSLGSVLEQGQNRTPIPRSQAQYTSPGTNQPGSMNPAGNPTAGNPAAGQMKTQGMSNPAMATDTANPSPTMSAPQAGVAGMSAPQTQRTVGGGARNPFAGVTRASPMMPRAGAGMPPRTTPTSRAGTASPLAALMAATGTDDTNGDPTDPTTPDPTDPDTPDPTTPEFMFSDYNVPNWLASMIQTQSTGVQDGEPQFDDWASGWLQTLVEEYGTKKPEVPTDGGDGGDGSIFGPDFLKWWARVFGTKLDPNAFQ